jgi:2-polyprenyl-6-methoxyphenol hydroxylase-like FAD-dependent oxidoreductase
MTARRILISGLGVGGPALAWHLLQHGFEPTIVEIAPAPREGGYMIDFWGVGYDVAERMGLLPTLKQQGYFIDDVRFVNEKNHRITGITGDSFRKALGERYLSIPRGDLAFAIWKMIEGRVPVIFDDEITALEQHPDHVDVRFRKSPPAAFDLVIGADGLHSNVRRLAFGAEAGFETFLGYWVAAFTTRNYPHRDENIYTSFSRPGKQIARYALRDGRTAFLLVWTGAASPAPPRHDVAAQKGFITEAFLRFGWEWPLIAPALENADDLYFDPMSQIHVPTWSAGRVALLGDAAWCPSLLAGEGTAFAMAGAYVLAGELAHSRGDHAIAFNTYERIYRPFIEKKQKDAVNFASQFAPKTPLGLFIRNMATRLLAVPVIGPALMKGMFGDPIDLPDYPPARS